nr:NAD(P)-dependent oxidoreductase [Stakelama sediminis]
MTGGTGFVGSRLIALARQAGYTVRALTRRPQPPRVGVEWIDGSLEDAPALARLTEGADAVIHVAGVVNAPDRAGFEQGNIEGTRAMLTAAHETGVHRYIQVSSLATREPGLSRYGWSKHEADKLVQASGLNWTIVRPPAIYGPGDHELLEIFRLAKHRLALLPPTGRLSVIHVDDLCRLFLTLVESDPGQVIFEPDDGVANGWSHKAFARAVGRAQNKRVLTLSLPRSAMLAGAGIDRMIRGKQAKLTRDRVSYFCHPDWVSAPARHPPQRLWQPKIDTPQGLADTARWYQDNGLL